MASFNFETPFSGAGADGRQRPGFVLLLQVNTTDRAAQNRTDVEIVIRIRPPGNFTTFSNIAGDNSWSFSSSEFSDSQNFTYSFASPNQNRVLEIGRRNYSVNHNSNGSKSINVSYSANARLLGSASRSNISIGLTTYPRAPNPPPSVTAQTPVARSIKVDWQAASGGAGVSNYDVDRIENNTSWVRILSSTTSLTTTSSGLNPRSTYRFRVRANGPGGSSGFRESNSQTIAPAASPPAISTARAGTSVAVSLGQSTRIDSGVTISSYTIQRRQSSNGGATWGNWGTTRSVNTTNRTTTYTGLLNGITYQFRGRAETNLGFSNWSESGLTTIPNPPQAPSSIDTVRVLRNVTVSLGTAAQPSGVTITGYSIERRESTNGGATYGAWGNARSTTTTNRTTTYTNLNPFSTYQFRGRAESDVGSGANRESDNILIPGIPDAPSQVFAVRQGAAIQVIVAEPTQDGGAPILTYKIEKRISEDFETSWSAWGDPVVINFSEPVYLYEELELQKTYQFRAVATNEQGDSEQFTESNTVYLPAIMRIYDDGQFRLPGDYKRYNEVSGSWVGLSISRRYFNEQWIDLE